MITRTPVSRTIAQRIQEMIQSGEIGKAERLPSQRILSERLGVSRPSLREALMTLETLGLVHTFPGKGTFVANQETKLALDSSQWRYSDDYSMQDVFEMRALIEGRLAYHAAKTSTMDDITILIAATDKMESAWENNELIANVDADLVFHKHIAEKSSNLLLLQTYRSISSLLNETQRQPIPFTAKDRMKDSIAEHRILISALHARDAEAAEAAMILHIHNTAACAGINLSNYNT